MFVILFLNGRLAVSGGHLLLSLNVRERKGLNERLSSFRRGKKKKKKEFLLAAAAPPELGEKAGKAAPPPQPCSLREGSEESPSAAGQAAAACSCWHSLRPWAAKADVPAHGGLMVEL